MVVVVVVVAAAVVVVVVVVASIVVVVVAMAGLVLSSSTTVVVPVSNVLVVVVAGSRDVGAFVGDALGNPEGESEEGTPVGGGVAASHGQTDGHQIDVPRGYGRACQLRQD